VTGALSAGVVDCAKALLDATSISARIAPATIVRGAV